MQSLLRTCLIILLFLSSNHLFALTRYWVYKGGFLSNKNWSNTSNWSASSGGVGLASVPVAGDNAIFDGGPLGLSVGDCIMNVAVSVGSITVTSGYTGTITQTVNSVMVSGNASFGGGTFNGGSADISIGGTFTLSATTFSCTPGTLELDGNAGFTGGSFAHNNGLVKFNGAVSQTLSGTSPVFYSLEFVGKGNTHTLSSSGNIIVANSLSISGSGSCTLNTGLLDLRGSLNLSNTATGGGGSATIDFTGVANQVINSSLLINQSSLPSVTINKTGGTLTFPALITVCGNWNYASGTTDVTANASTVAFSGNGITVSSAGMQLYNVVIAGNTSTLLNDMTIKNDLTISGTGILSAGSNTINLSGNWTDYGIAGFDEGGSTVNFNGTTPQTISAPGGESFNNMQLNNSGGGIQFMNNIGVEANLLMLQGNINLNGNDLLLGISALNNGTLAYSAGIMYGTGTFTRWFNTNSIADGSVNGLFPLGMASDFRPFYLSAPSTGPSSGGTVTVAYMDASTNTTTPVFMDGSSTILVRKDLHWTVTTGNGLAGGVYNLDVRGTALGTIGIISDLRLTLAGSVVGLPGINGGSTLDPQVNRSGLATSDLSNAFYVGSVDDLSSPLPVTLVSFTAFVSGGQVQLKWITALEVDNDYFIVQRSKDGADWFDMERIDGNGSSGESYSANDKQPYAGTSYYRLVQTDFDGRKTYSAIRPVLFQ